MMKIRCKCGGEDFECFFGVYAKEIVATPHIEVVCKKCKHGFVLSFQSHTLETVMKKIEEEDVFVLEKDD